MKSDKKSFSSRLLIVVSVIFVMAIVFAYYYSNIIEPEQKYKLGIELFEKGNYEEAQKIFIELIDYKESKNKLNALYIKYGQINFEKGDYFEAIRYFEKVRPINLTIEKITEANYLIGLSEYKKGNIEEALKYFRISSNKQESRDVIGEIFYLRAEEYLVKEDYYSAILNFEEVKYYKDATERILEIRYTLGSKYLTEKNYSKAMGEFLTIGDYKDSKRKLAIIDAIQFRSAKVGDSIYWGNYEQNYVVADGDERIEWVVIEKTKNKLLVLSKYGLEALPYNNVWELTYWENSYIRKWLNEDFYVNAFTIFEKEIIKYTLLENKVNISSKADQC